MTPKELRNLKRLIKSGDEDNIRLALAMSDKECEKIYKVLDKLRVYAYDRFFFSEFKSGIREFYWQCFTKILTSVRNYEYLRHHYV